MGNVFNEIVVSLPSSHPPRALFAPGTLVNTNTIEEFKDLDKTALFQESVDQVYMV